MKSHFALILTGVMLCSGCKKTSVYFVPIGNAPVAEINELVPHYEEKFDLKAEVLSPMALSPTDFDSYRQQLIAERVLQNLDREYARYLKDRSAVLIGITSQDMYLLQANWQFCFGWRRPEIRMAVVSTARMNLYYPGETMPIASVSSRLRKMVTKDIGIMYYHREASSNPRSVLYNGILGLEELDQVSEDF
jgi:predicted Zn-dependent protease